MKSTKPYFLRAILEWAEDSGYTPQVLVDAGVENTEVPRDFVKDGQIVLNVSTRAVRNLMVSNEHVTFIARFSGVPHNIFLPMSAVLAVYARENGHGIYFQHMDDNNSAEQKGEQALTQDGEKKSRQAGKKDRSHLTIIK